MVDHNGLTQGLWCAALCAFLASCVGVEPTGSSAQAIRPDQAGIGPPAFDSTERVEVFGSRGGTFLVHFTRAGRNAVPALDVDGSGTPDFVEEVAEVYDRVLAFYRDMRGLRAPPSDIAVSGGNGGDGRFDVYLVDFAGRSDGAFRREGCASGAEVSCAGYMLQENDFVGYSYPSTRIGTTVLSSHEFFHAIQAGYDGRRGPILEEATAVWGTEQFDPSLRDFEGFVGGYLSRPDRSLDQVQTGPVDAFSYGAAIFFQFLTERYDARVVPRLWTACGADDGSTGWLDVLDSVLRRDYASTFAAEYSEFVVWNLYTAARASPRRAYANGSAYPLVATVRAALPFTDNQVRLFHAATRYYAALPGDRRALAVALVVPPGGSVDSLDGLELRVAVRRGNTVDEPRRLASLTAGTETVEVSSGAEAIFLITNVLTAGASRTPGLCIGSPDEVAQCRAMLAPAPATDAGSEPDVVGDSSITNDVGDAGASADAGPDAGLASPVPSGCACTAVGDRGRSATSLGALLLGLACALRPRRVLK